MYSLPLGAPKCGIKPGEPKLLQKLGRQVGLNFSGGCFFTYSEIIKIRDERFRSKMVGDIHNDLSRNSLIKAKALSYNSITICNSAL